MSVEEILFHIDAELGRLQRAHDFLAGVTPSGKRKRRRSRLSKPAPKVAQAVQPKPKPTVPRVIRYPEKAFRDRGTRRRGPVVNNETAGLLRPLSRAVPAGPVAVSAQEARQARARWDESQHGSVIRIEENPTRERTLGSLIAKLGPLAAVLEPSS